ncbi:MAG TPA: cation:proton antiporter [Bacteroidales bacterium]|nr:cation:proton antiporter [Bacteroidales bacterium]
MPHLPSLIFDLALILVSASIMTLLFKALKQPLVLGYIVAGILAGPHLQLLPVHITDTANVQTWADIGVLFLLFALGLEFSFKKLLAVGKTALLTATVAVSGMMLTGYLVGTWLGWSHINCLFLGGMLAISSTTIIIKAFNDLGMTNKPCAPQVFGVLIVQDLVAVILMVMLSTLSVSDKFNGSELLFSLTRLVFFLALWFIFGIFLIPTFLKRARKLMSEETLLIVSLGLCLGMVVVAVKAGFSAALGAFIMGSILAETTDVKRIEKMMEPLKNLFGAIFFVSVGMMVQPEILTQYAGPIGILVITVLLGQVIFSTTGFLLSGQTLQTAMQSGFSLAQIGEFAFIIASLGLSLGVTDSFLYPVVIAVSVITTFTTPYMIKLAQPAYRFLNRRLPEEWAYKLSQPRGRKELTSGQKTWGNFLRDFLVYTVVLSIVVVAIMLLSTLYLHPFLLKHLSEGVASLLSFFLTLTAMAPFLRAMMYSNGNSASSMFNLSMEKASNQHILLLLTGLRIFTVFVTLLFATNTYFHIPWFVNLVLTLIILIVIIRSKWLLRRFWRLEARFLINLNEQQMEKNLLKIEANKGVMDLSEMQTNHWLDYKLFTCALRLRPGSPFVGQRIRDLTMRKVYNVMVIRVRTKEMDFINIPDGDYVLQPGDTLRLAGKRSSLRKLQEDELLTLEFVPHSFMTLHGFSKLEFNRKEQKERVTCSGIPLTKKSPLTGKNLIESNLGAKAKCLIVGLERGGKQLVNPDAKLVLEVGDVVWVVGEEKPVSRLIERNVY